ncbi:MAG: hypothetical protein C3F08_09370 [Candidatus Methylomirabilota bacterium]|nr:MAG: hypothetical protein C3F08_09370 [candidate division NC10 bacterium]
MKKRDAVVALLPLLIMALLVGWACSRFSLPSSTPTEGLRAQPTPAASTQASRPQWVGPPPDARYVGSESCLACHKESTERFHKTRIGRIMSVNPRTPQERRDCESCHGPGGPHVASEGGALETMITFEKGAEPVEAQNAACVTCHEKGEHTFWKGSPHELRGLACVSCHKVMESVSDRYNLTKPTAIEVCSQCHQTRRAQLQRSSHMPLREGKISCGDCHNPHGTATQAMLREDSVNENCYKCHAEKRGPFLWEHAPVIESCSNCHEPHGSTNARLLKVRIPRLCQECHIETRHPTNPYDPKTGTRFVVNRGCINCHQKIHGSNHPSGFAFTN